MRSLYVRPAGEKGRGVFTSAPILSGDLVERCEALVLKHPRRGSTLDHYVFRHGAVSLLALGNGSLYNHSARPNCVFTTFSGNGRAFVLFHAVRDIAAGEELTINYGPDLWFRPVKERKNRE